MSRDVHIIRNIRSVTMRRVTGGVPLRELFVFAATRVVPLGLVTGATMEAFMYVTGFWSVATQRESARQTERALRLDRSDAPPSRAERPY